MQAIVILLLIMSITQATVLQLLRLAATRRLLLYSFLRFLFKKGHTRREVSQRADERTEELTKTRMAFSMNRRAATELPN